MLNLNDTSINSEGSKFDGSKIFGYEVVEDNTIVRFVENVRVIGFAEGVSNTGNAFWDIQVVDSKGNESNIREYDVDTTRDGWEKSQDSQLKRLKHLLSKFVPEGTALPQANTFPELWKAVQNLMVANACQTKPIRLKLVYNNKGYLTVPKYVPYMEPMTVPAAQTKLKLDPKFDTLIRPSASNPASAPAATEAAPFQF